MTWIYNKLIKNKFINWGIYIALMTILVLDLIIENYSNSKTDLISYNHYLIGLLIIVIYEILRKYYKSVFNRNKAILDKIPGLLKNENLNELIQELEKIKIISSQLIQKTYWRGVAKTYLKQSESALIDFDLIRDDYNNFPDYNYHKALAYNDINKHEDALELLNRVIIYKPIAQVFDQRGVTFMMLERFDDAESDLKESINISEESYNTCNMGVLLSKKGEFKKAIEYFDKTIKLDSNNSIGFLNRGYCKCKDGDIKNGLIDLKKALDLGNKKAEKLIKQFENK
jgi:tetratricopeptide (TPR) repeat protein